jgi:polo-like kinase 1
LGHSYEVDIWSLGVIAYACLVGRPPFETNDVKTTYNRIKMCNYSFPDHITLSTVTKHFISKMLQKDPRHRLTVDEILSDEFFSFPIPDSLPTTLLACPPNAHFLNKFQNPGLLELKHRESTETQSTQKTDRQLEKGESTKTLMRTNSIEQLSKPNYGQRAASTTTLARGRMLSSKIEVPKTLPSNPQQPPFVWVTFFEENPKFGTAYMLNSNSMGMKFNDSTCLIANNHFLKMKYIDLMNREEPTVEVFEAAAFPERLSKKLKIISYYQRELKTKKEIYENGLNNEQIIEKEKHRFRETPENAMGLWVTKLYKTSKAHFFWFSNKDYQVVFQDNTELLFSKDQVTYVSKLGQRLYFNRTNLDAQSEEIKKRANYAANSLQTFKENSKGANKENNMVRSSSVIKMEKPQPVMLRGSASTSRIPPPRVLKY